MLRFDELGEDRNVACPVDEKRSKFRYLRRNDETGVTEICYDLWLSAPGGRLLCFEGRKRMRRDRAASPHEMLEDYTTLQTRVFEGESQIGHGLLKFRTFEDIMAAQSMLAFARSFRITGSDNQLVQSQACLKFLAFTAQFVQGEYGP